MFAALIFGISAGYVAAAQGLIEPRISFIRDIAPILNQKCVACHGPVKQKGGYRVDSFVRMMKPGDSLNPPISPGRPDQSELLELITTESPEDRMPQKDTPLTPEQITRIKRWIEAGAEFDAPDRSTPISLLIPREPYPAPPASYAHPVPVRALAFTPDGSSLAVGGYHEVTIWNAQNGKMIRRLANLPEKIQGLGFDATGGYLVVAGGSPGRNGEALLISFESGAEQAVLARSSDIPGALAFSPDRSQLAVGFADGAIRLFALPQGRQRLALQPHADGVTGLAFSPDGAHLASASRDRSARVFDSRNGELESTYMEHGTGVTAITFNPDGQHVFSGGNDKTIHVWKTADAKKVNQIGGIDEVAFQLLVTDDQLYSACSDGIIRRHSAKDRQMIGSLPGDGNPVLSLAFHPTTGLLASGTFEGRIRIWNPNSNENTFNFLPVPGSVAR